MTKYKFSVLTDTFFVCRNNSQNVTNTSTKNIDIDTRKAVIKTTTYEKTSPIHLAKTQVNDYSSTDPSNPKSNNTTHYASPNTKIDH